VLFTVGKDDAGN